MVIMSHQCKEKRSRSRILSYFQTVLGGPKDKHLPLLTAMTSHVTQDTLKTAEAHKTVVKVKRKKTRRELNRTKFGKMVVGKLFNCKPGRLVQDMPAADKCHCQRVGNSRAAETSVPKPPLNPSWIITQNRLTHHLGIFNKEVKSIDIERLLKGEQTKDCRPAVAKESPARLVEDAVEVTSCTPVPAGAVVSIQQPRSLTPKLQATMEDAHITRGSPAQAAESEAQCPRDLEGPVAPTTDLAQKVIQTLNTHRVFPGQNLVRSTQQQLVNILVERHGGQPGPWVSALWREQEPGAAPTTGISRPQGSGFNPLDESTIVNKFLSPRGQPMGDSFLLQNNGSVWRPASSMPSALGSFAVTAGSRADGEHVFNAAAHRHPWLWGNTSSSLRTQAAWTVPRSPAIGRASPFTKWEPRSQTTEAIRRRLDQRQGVSGTALPPVGSRSPGGRVQRANASLARILEAYRDSPGGGGARSPLRPHPGKEEAEGPKSQGQRLGDGRDVTQRGTVVPRRRWQSEDVHPTIRGNQALSPVSAHTMGLKSHPRPAAEDWAPHRVGDHRLLDPRQLGLSPWPTWGGRVQPRPWEPWATLPVGPEVPRAGLGPGDLREARAEEGPLVHWDLTNHWPGPVWEAGEGSGQGAVMALDWDGWKAGPPVPAAGPGRRAASIPLSLCYPPSDALEWSDSPLPNWGAVPWKHGWDGLSPETWVFPRMRLY